MIIIILLVAMVVFLFSRTPTSKITGFASIPLQTSPMASQTFDIEGFNEIFINGKGNLFLTQGGNYHVKKSVLGIAIICLMALFSPPILGSVFAFDKPFTFGLLGCALF